MTTAKILKHLQELGIHARIKPGRRPAGIPEGAAIWLLGDLAHEVLAVADTLREANLEGVAPDLPRLWLADYVPEQKAQEWIAAKRPFADAVGNAFLNFPGLIVRVLGNRPAKNERERVGREWRGPALRVLFLMLCEPEFHQLTVRTLGELCEAAPGTIMNLFRDLEHTGHLIKIDRLKRRFVPDRELFDRWIQEYGRKLRPDLLLGRFVADDLDWHRELDLEKHGALWGGEAAAELLGAELRPGIRTIYLRKPIGPFLKAAKLHAAKDGNIELREIFWTPQLQPAPELLVTPPVLVAADLLATRDGRCMAAAAQITERLLDRTTRPEGTPSAGE